MRSAAIRSDGTRERIIVADVAGRFSTSRKFTFAMLWIVFILTPFLHWRGEPLLLFDIAHRHFAIAGFGFSAQDTYLLFFVITGVVFALFFLTALAGRVWCGWACPQTALVEGVFRRVERWIDGPRQSQMQFYRASWSLKKILRRVVKHTIFLALAFGIAAWSLRYFLSPAEWRDMWIGGHSLAFTCFLVVGALLYFDGAWFREQLCIFVCPYGRLQSVLTDDDTFVVGYDTHRGEPRGKKSQPARGDCIDCHRCVDVCPTGIDIRHGMQLECIGCANCIDACNDVMHKIGQRAGLIRYDSLRGFRGAATRVLRTRIYLYIALAAIGVIVAGAAFRGHHPMVANLIRLPGAPYILQEDLVRNQLYVHLVNTTDAPLDLIITSDAPAAYRVTTPMHELTLAPRAEQRVPMFVDVARADYRAAATLHVHVQTRDAHEVIEKNLPLLGP